MTDQHTLRFDGRGVLVTGAARGLGRAYARLLGARGASVLVNDVGDAQTVADEIVAAGGVARAHVGDVAAPHGADAAVAAAIDAFGRVDALVANAGVLRSAAVAETTDDLWDEVVGVNLRAAFRTARAAWPMMAQRGSGRIVFATSNSGLLGVPGSSAYAASKAGLWGLMRVLALEGADVGISVNAVAPIAFTPMSAQSRAAPESWRTGSGDAWAARLDPELVAPVVAWLAHEDCPFTGEVLSAAGGRVARFFLGLTPGIVDEHLTIEAVRDHQRELTADAGYEVLTSASDEARRLHRRLMR